MTEQNRYVLSHHFILDRPNGSWAISRDGLHDKDDVPEDFAAVLGLAIDSANVADGDEIEIVVRRTGRRPYGDRRFINDSRKGHRGREKVAVEHPRCTCAGKEAKRIPWLDVDGRRVGEICSLCRSQWRDKLHNDACPLRRALGPGRVECEHGYDVCPACDRCTCAGPAAEQ